MSTIDEGLIQDSPSQLELLNETLQFIDEIRKWARFLSILGFVFIGLMLIAGIAMGSILGSVDSSEMGLPFPAGALGMIYVVLAVLYVFPVLYLYRFSQKAGNALETEDSEELKLAFMNLKSHYKFIGIMAIVLIVLYVVILIGGLGAGLFMGM